MNLTNKNLLVFSTRSYQYLKEELLKNKSFEEGIILSKTFPDGEHYYRIDSDVHYREIVLLGGTTDDADTLEVYDLACGLVEAGARVLHLVIPYFGYATMERAVKKGEIVTAKTRARLLSAIPQASFGNKAYFVDLHSEGIPHYLEGNIRPTHLYAKTLISEAARGLAGSDFVLASTDAGRAKWVESLANDMNVSAAFVYKRRVSGSQTTVTGINADVKGKIVVMYDDMIRTGGSLLHAAKSYLDAGATRIFAIATHGIFPNNAIDKIRQSGLIEKIVVTNTHPNAIKLESDFLTVVSIAPLLESALQ